MRPLASPYAILRIASDRRYRDKEGNRLTDFISIKVRARWRNAARSLPGRAAKLAASGDFETITFRGRAGASARFPHQSHGGGFLSPRRVEENVASMPADGMDEAAA